MLRAMTFDLWETLIHENPSFEGPRRDYRVREVGRVLREKGIDVSALALEQAHKDLLVRMDPFWGANLDLSIVEQTKMFIELAAGVRVDGRLPPAALLEAARHYGEAALHYAPLAAAGAQQALVAARGAGLRIALLCNTGRTPGRVLREILGHLELRAHFDVLCFSDEVRLRKPAVEFFTRSLSRMGIRPDEAAHVGDMPETDLAGARACGMRTVHLRRAQAPEAPPGLADYVITDISQLPDILSRLVSSDPSGTVPPPGGRNDFGKETSHL